MVEKESLRWGLAGVLYLVNEAKASCWSFLRNSCLKSMQLYAIQLCIYFHILGEHLKMNDSPLVPRNEQQSLAWRVTLSVLTEPLFVVCDIDVGIIFINCGNSGQKHRWCAARWYDSKEHRWLHVGFCCFCWACRKTYTLSVWT